MDKLKVLTEKLLNEGVEKGQKEANQIISKAKDEAEKIIKDAKSDAEKIINTAQKEVEEKKRKTGAELKLASNQSVSLLKNQISSLISEKLANDGINKSFDDKTFVQNMILKLLESWVKNGAQAFDIKIYLPKVDKNDLNTFISKNCKEYLSKGIEIQISDELKSGFKIGPKDSSYMVDFDEESFKTFFKQFLKPIVRELIFNN